STNTQMIFKFYLRYPSRACAVLARTVQRAVRGQGNVIKMSMNLTSAFMIYRICNPIMFITK
ncbi:hypothetical protein L9F63_008011, partial [Diploptera punctata]